MSEYTRHKAHWDRARIDTLCAAWHRTFAGRCLNCGYVEGGYNSVRDVIRAREADDAARGNKGVR